MKFKNINPNQSIQGQLFGLPINPEKAQIILMPAPWSVSSTETGTVLAPETILRKSHNVGLYQASHPDAWRIGIAMLPIPHGWKLKSNQLSDSAKTYLQASQAGSKVINTQLTTRLDQYTIAFKDRIKNKALLHMHQNKMVGLVGGEQTCALGLIEACAEHHKNFGILHLDAHADLKPRHQGLLYSHATVMYHALHIPQVQTLTQVSLRNYCEEEAHIIQQNPDRITSFTDHTLKQALSQGTTWHHLCQDIIAKLPQKIYISFDIHALDPKLCPSTARPVPGGLELHQAHYLIEKIVEAGKQIIAFDLSEVAFNGETEWDALVASHLLYQLSISMGLSQGKL